MQLNLLDYLLTLIFFTIIFSCLWLFPESFKMGHFIILSGIYAAGWLMFAWIRERRKYS